MLTTETDWRRQYWPVVVCVVVVVVAALAGTGEWIAAPCFGDELDPIELARAVGSLDVDDADGVVMPLAVCVLLAGIW